nr:MAG TPA: hypothetical protein [Caudoviricetes sp.]
MTGRNRLLLNCIIQTSRIDWFSFCPNCAEDFKSCTVSPPGVKRD